MSDLDLSEFFKYSRPKKRPCAIGHYRERLASKREQAQLDAACNEDQGLITAGAIVTWLENHGADSGAVTTSAVVNHRKNRCTCKES